MIQKVAKINPSIIPASKDSSENYKNIENCQENCEVKDECFEEVTFNQLWLINCCLAWHDTRQEE